MKLYKILIHKNKIKVFTQDGLFHNRQLYLNEVRLNRNIINMDGYARVLTNDYNISREFSAIYYTNNNNDLALNILEY